MGDFGDTERGGVVVRGCNIGSVSARSTIVLKKFIDASQFVSGCTPNPLDTAMRLLNRKSKSARVW